MAMRESRGELEMVHILIWRVVTWVWICVKSTELYAPYLHTVL